MLQQSTTTAILFSFLSWASFNPLLYGRAQHLLQKNEKRTIRLRQSTTTAILFSFPFVGVVQPTVWQGTMSTTKGQKRTIRLQQLTTTAIPERQSTTTIRHCQEKGITNCVLLLLSNWSKCIPTQKWCRIHTALQMQNTCVSEKGKCKLTLLCILQWKAIPWLTWDLNAEMIEKIYFF